MSVNDFFNDVEVISKFYDGVTTSYIRIYVVVNSVRLPDGQLCENRHYHLTEERAKIDVEVSKSLPSVEDSHIVSELLFL